MAFSDPPSLWRREMAELEGRLRIHIRQAVDRALFDKRMTDHRTPKDFSVVPNKLSRHATDNTLRAVNDPLMLGTNVVGGRALAEHSTNNLLRSVFTDHVGNEILIARHHADLSVPTRALQDGSVTFAKLAKPSVGAIELFDLNVTNAKLAADSVTKSKVAGQSIGILEAHNELRGGDITDWRLRRMGGTTAGTNQTAAMADHFHSVPFTWLPKAERIRINALALTLRSYRETALGPVRDLLEAMDAVLHMLCDDPDLDRWERERKLDADPEWAKDYRLAHHMHH
ncbi:MAG: hypothetical protein M3Q10_20330, partial [Chloroflexota bacterium]|nr:hypothetical protein [Chloroflexota bacterium]